VTDQRVEVDTTMLVAAVRQLTRGIDRGVGPVAERTAGDVARDLHGRIPKRTGRLAATVRTSHTNDGAQVHYGGTLPYANYIANRTGAVDDARAGADHDFKMACETLAATEVRRL